MGTIEKGVKCFKLNSKTTGMTSKDIRMIVVWVCVYCGKSKRWNPKPETLGWIQDPRPKTHPTGRT